MNEIKKPRKPLIYYYAVAIVIVILFNSIVMPWLVQRQVKEVDYGTFMTMTEEKDIGRVEIQTNQIIFTDKADESFYKTGLMDDPQLVERLHDAGAIFASEIIEETSPLLSFLLTWILPMVIFFGVGQLLSKKMMDRAGGANSMMFNMGKSNAKVYVKSSEGINFSDVEVNFSIIFLNGSIWVVLNSACFSAIALR